MPRTYLDVPYEQKDEAKGLGAKWDNQQRVWFVPDGVALEPFSKWLPVPPAINVRADHYYIMEASKNCWKCHKPTRVFAFAMPPDHESLEDVDDEDMDFESDEAYEAWASSPESTEWRTPGAWASICYVEYVSSAVEDRLHEMAPQFQIDSSKTTGSSYWMNHCECCGMKQGDFEMHCEPRGAFLPLYPEDAARIILRRIDEPFEAVHGGYSCDLEFFEVMIQA